MGNDQIQDLLAWTSNAGWVYEPWLGFKEKARRSTYVNVSDLGIRFNSANENPDSKIEGSVWFFGGSTTFGYGVADAETIPARLEALIRQPVVNFGRAHYYSAQENFLFSSLLKSGFKPRAAIFLDGINERCDIETYQTEVSRLFAKAQAYNWDFTEVFKPLFNMATKLAIKMGISQTPVYDLHKLECTRYGKSLPLSYVIAGNLSERRDICKAHSVRCYVFVQPFAGVHGVHEDYDNFPPGDRQSLLDKFNHLSSTWNRSGALFIIGSLNSLHEHAFVDSHHYSALASGLIAKAIAEHLGNDY